MCMYEVEIDRISQNTLLQLDKQTELIVIRFIHQIDIALFFSAPLSNSLSLVNHIPSWKRKQEFFTRDQKKKQCGGRMGVAY